VTESTTTVVTVCGSNVDPSGKVFVHGLGDFTYVVCVRSKRPLSFCTWTRVIGREFTFVCDSGVHEIHQTILIDRHDRRPAVDSILPGNPSIWIGYHRESQLVLARDLGCAHQDRDAHPVRCNG
jgi:hypothetical protein